MESMAVDGDDPLLLFTPQKRTDATWSSTSPPPGFGNSELTNLDSREGSFDATRQREARKELRLSHISPPPLDEETKSRYVFYDFSESDSDVESADIVEIVGEYRIGETNYLYARHKDDIVRRKEDWEFEENYPELYHDYEMRKENGDLEDFDPSATYVDPKHRVGLIISISKSEHNHFQLTRNAQRRHMSNSYKSSESEQSEDSDNEESEGGDDDYSGPSTRRPTRKARNCRKGANQSKLSFGTRKTKSQGRSQRTKSEDELSDSDSRAMVRRSSRARPKGRIHYERDGEEDYEDMAESSDFDKHDAIVIHKSKTKAKSKRKGPRPAYGRVRSVDDLDESEGESDPLRAHRPFCEKCKKDAAHILIERAKRKGGRKKKKRTEDEFEEGEEEQAINLGGWVRCLKCCIAAHWRCLAKSQQDEILKAARAKDDPDRAKRMNLETDETTEFVCGSCSKGGLCMGCNEVAVQAEVVHREENTAHEPTATAPAEKNTPVPKSTTPDCGSNPPLSEPPADEALLFRCLKCKRLAHYAHLVDNDDKRPLRKVASQFQMENDWECGDCASFTFGVDKILAWRPYPSGVVDPRASTSDPPNYKENLPREYLIKFQERSYRRVQWVPHMWLSATAPSMLRHFLANGPKVELLPAPLKGSVEDDEQTKPSDASELPAFVEKEDSRESSSAPSASKVSSQPLALLDAEDRIPPKWKTVDRVLDVRIWSPLKNERPKGNKKKRKGVPRISDDEEDTVSVGAKEELVRIFNNGDTPSPAYIETVTDYEVRTGHALTVNDISKVVWAFFKWDDLPYDEATWDSPPPNGTPGHDAFVSAFVRFIESRSVTIPKVTKELERERERRRPKGWSSKYLGVTEDGKHDIGQAQSLSLMDFQVDGVNWLCMNWFHHQQCILADEMGLGKTVQIVTFLGLLYQRLKVFPCLVVVPHTTITNWVREFGRWAPQLRVVPFYGESNSREVIKRYELFHEDPTSGTVGGKFHVLVTTYETVTTQKEMAAVFKKIPRWEVLIVDEGQRLKGDANLLFRRLTEMQTMHRVLMTGTPLNNNIRELFNLMRFLDAPKWTDLDALTKEFEVLDDERIKMLHEMLRPYFLRRVKADVLKLPPKNEVIVPVSMAPLQKEVYKSILSKNAALLASLTSTASTRVNNVENKRTNLNNLLMQLRKCLQHPYTISRDIEPKGLSNIEAHAKLIDGCGKLRLLKILLPQLKAKGHRVLLFSQFKLALDIIEDFLSGEGYKFLRLDGEVKQAQRQKDMDEFNRKDSDIFIYILTTRAGGVGINLWSADTVIIFDPDFNPHQDLQAIARAHRYGQTKTCLVFKLMTKDSAEEKIVQAGKKKLVLDHLIVQSLDKNEDANDVQSILTFGADALFNEQDDESRNITYSEQDVAKLIEKTETEVEVRAEETSNNAFSFAKIWSLHKDDFEELEEDKNANQEDAWAPTLAKLAENQKSLEKEEKVGRGARRKAKLVKNYFEDDGSPSKPAIKPKRKSMSVDSEDDYQAKEIVSDSDDHGGSSAGSDILGFKEDLGSLLERDEVITKSNGREPPASKKSKKAFLSRSPIFDQGAYSLLDERDCGLCGRRHGPKACYMTQSSKNLVEYRQTLIYHTEDESWEARVKAVEVIDATLFKRGELSLINGQPLHPFRGRKKAISHNPDERIDLKKSNARELSQSHVVAKQPVRAQGIDRRFKAGGLSATPIEAARLMTKKRQAAPGPDTSGDIRKRPKLTYTYCPVCEQTPLHDLKQCPVVVQGNMEIISTVVRRLQRDSEGHAPILEFLRSRGRQILQERAASASTASTSTLRIR